MPGRRLWWWKPGARGRRPWLRCCPVAMAVWAAWWPGAVTIDGGGGCAMLLDKARALVLPGHHGRVGGVVAGVWRSVAVIVGRGENLLYLRTAGGGEDRSLLQGVVAAFIACHAAPEETLILGSGGGGAPASYPS